MTIRQIEAENTLDLRSRILRPGQSLELCSYLEDNLPSTFHLAVIVDERIVCNGTFIQQDHPRFAEASFPYRLRGMATEPSFQKKGLGTSLIQASFKMLAERHCDLLWFNARVSAEKFYQKLGFDTINEVFEIPLIGPHKVMFKWLER